MIKSWHKASSQQEGRGTFLNLQQGGMLPLPQLLLPRHWACPEKSSGCISCLKAQNNLTGFDLVTEETVSKITQRGGHVIWGQLDSDVVEMDIPSSLTVTLSFWVLVICHAQFICLWGKKEKKKNKPYGLNHEKAIIWSATQQPSEIFFSYFFKLEI